MNLFEGRIEDRRVVVPGGTLPLPADDAERWPGLAAYRGKDIIFGIRPEDLHDSGLEFGARLPTIPAQVRTIEELGSELIVHVNVDAVRIDSGDPDAVEDLGSAANAVAKFDAASDVRANESIALAVDVGKLHFFDPGTLLAIH
jgi:multiple sugar transport system ATP-binding protein